MEGAIRNDYRNIYEIADYKFTFRRPSAQRLKNARADSTSKAISKIALPMSTSPRADPSPPPKVDFTWCCLRPFVTIERRYDPRNGSKKPLPLFPAKITREGSPYLAMQKERDEVEERNWQFLSAPLRERLLPPSPFLLQISVRKTVCASNEEERTSLK